MTPTKRRATGGRAGSLKSSKRTLWLGISRTKDAMLVAENHGQIVSACHALSQACTAYARLIEAGELEARLRAVEKIIGPSSGDR